MGRILISDYTCSSEVLIWNREWEQFKPNLQEGEIYKFELEKKDDEGTLVLKKCTHSSNFNDSSAVDCKIYLSPFSKKESLEELKSYLSSQSGTVSVSFVLSTDTSEREIETRYRIDDNTDIYTRLKGFECVKSCKVI